MTIGHIGNFTLHEAVNHRHHLVDVFGRPRLIRRLQIAECSHIRLELPVGGFRYLPDSFVQRQIRKILGSPRIDLVVNISDVAHIGDVAFAIDMAQQPVQYVEDDYRPRIADMGVIIDRRAADIHAHVLPVDRHKDFLRAGERVVEAELVRHVGCLKLGFRYSDLYQRAGLLTGVFRIF